MKVWVVEFGEYSDRNVSGVYSSEEKARIAARADGDITEYELDEAMDLYGLGLRYFCVEMDKEGRVIKTDNWGYFSDPSPFYEVTFRYLEGKRPAILYFRGRLWAKSEEQAIKATNEQRAQSIASGEWDKVAEEQRKTDEHYAEIEARMVNVK